MMVGIRTSTLSSSFLGRLESRTVLIWCMSSQELEPATTSSEYVTSYQNPSTHSFHPIQNGKLTQVLTTLVAHGLDPMLLEGKEIKIIEKKNAGNDKADEGLDRISKNLFKNLHLVFAMDLTNPEVNGIPHQFPFLMSKFVTNHIQPYTVEVTI